MEDMSWRRNDGVGGMDEEGLMSDAGGERMGER